MPPGWPVDLEPVSEGDRSPGPSIDNGRTVLAV